MAKPKSASKGGLIPPNPDYDKDTNRDQWITQAFDEFVSTSKAHREYYKVFLETIWPMGHGIPGPHITEDEIRDAIDDFRRIRKPGVKPYKDVFRRFRELQGEEGFLGIVKVGRRYQLVDLTVSSKRIPRTRLPDAEWNTVLANYDYSCTVCGRKEPEVQFEQDHKIPRLRGGNDTLANHQPLCKECNNFKSTACRGCFLDCTKCPWAFPEKYAPIKLGGEITEVLRDKARKLGRNPNDVAEEAIIYFFDNT